MKKTPVEPLRVQTLQTNPALMRLLPPEIARQHHALPISMDGQRITLAMAHPEDEIACRVVTAAIGAPACIVQADSQEIDRMIDEIWPNPSLQIAAWDPAPERLTNIQSFARSLAKSLNAKLQALEVPPGCRDPLAALLGQAGELKPDLLITPNPQPNGLRRLFQPGRTQQLIENLAASLLFVRDPHWPVTNLLLVVQDGSARTDSALEWAICLGRASQARITVLPLLPPVPRLYGQFLQHSLPALLDADDPLGHKLRWIAHRLAEEDLDGCLKLGEGFPQEQLQGELQASDPGMVLIAAGPDSPVHGWVFGNLVNDLASGLDRNLFIAKP
jgi:nucleotide-binding universal stress UspA family protein